MLLIFPFLIKTLGTQFAPPPIFLFTMPISYQQNFNTLYKQKKKKKQITALYNYAFIKRSILLGLCEYK